MSGGVCKGGACLLLSGIVLGGLPGIYLIVCIAGWLPYCLSRLCLLFLYLLVIEVKQIIISRDRSFGRVEVASLPV